MRSLEFDEAAAIELVMRLMAVAGPSCEEQRIAEVVVGELIRAGVPQEAIVFDTAHQRTRQRGNVGNLWVRLPGSLPQPCRMLSAHLDTVPICVGAQPIREGDLVRSADSATGLGGDNRAGVAVLITAIGALLRSNIPHPPLVGCFFVQEEIGLEGSRNLDLINLKDVLWACNFDGGYPHRLTIGATGGQKIDITIQGRAAHAGVAPQNGISAIVIAAKAIARLKDQGWLGRVEKEGPRSGTANIGMISGGHATNVVTPLVNIRAESRSHDLTFNREISNQIVAAFEQAAKETTNLAGEHGFIQSDIRIDYEPFRLPETAIPVSICREAIIELGLHPELHISDGGLDANWLVRHGIPTVTLGCGQREIHTSSEYLDLPDYLKACRIALRIAAGEEAR